MTLNDQYTPKQLEGILLHRCDWSLWERVKWKVAHVLEALRDPTPKGHCRSGSTFFIYY